MQRNTQLSGQWSNYCPQYLSCHVPSTELSFVACADHHGLGLISHFLQLFWVLQILQQCKRFWHIEPIHDRVPSQQLIHPSFQLGEFVEVDASIRATQHPGKGGDVCTQLAYCMSKGCVSKCPCALSPCWQVIDPWFQHQPHVNATHLSKASTGVTNYCDDASLTLVTASCVQQGLQVAHAQLQCRPGTAHSLWWQPRFNECNQWRSGEHSHTPAIVNSSAASHSRSVSLSSSTPHSR
jgi:hypothetical protein